MQAAQGGGGGAIIVRDDDLQTRFVYAPSALGTGDEFLNDYGALSNEQLLMLYVFRHLIVRVLFSHPHHLS